MPDAGDNVARLPEILSTSKLDPEQPEFSVASLWISIV